MVGVVLWVDCGVTAELFFVEFSEGFTDFACFGVDDGEELPVVLAELVGGDVHGLIPLFGGSLTQEI